MTPAELFVAYAQVTLVSFGGVMFWMRRLLVERRRWLTNREFIELVAIAQLMPGVNGINLAAMIGYRFCGWRGAAAALAGFLGSPVIVIIAIAVLHDRYGELPLVQHALAGMSAVAVGLLIATAAQLSVVLQRRLLAWLFVLLVFLGVGVMRWPLLAVLAALAPCAVLAAWTKRM